MATSFVDNFYLIDPYAPPPAGTALTAVDYTVTDRNDNGQIGSADRDLINGQRITASYPGDTVTVQYPDGSTQTITGVTFYLRDGSQVFSPIDGSTLQDATFVSSTYTTSNTPVTPSQMAVTCFAPGTMIETASGLVAVEALQVGQRVRTLDHGYEKVRWIGRRTVSGRGVNAPIRFLPGAIGNARELVVSPQHRMLVQGWQAELISGATQVLVAAKHLVNGDTIVVSPRDSVDYLHVCFDRHEIIFAEGVATESFQPGDYVLQGDRKLRKELAEIFPELAGQGGVVAWASARPVLRAAEARLVA